MLHMLQLLDVMIVFMLPLSAQELDKHRVLIFFMQHFPAYEL